MNREELNSLTHDTFGRYTQMAVHDFMGTEFAVVLCATGCLYLKNRLTLVWCTDITDEAMTSLPIQSGGELFVERHYGLFVHMDWMSFANNVRRIRPVLLPGVTRRYFTYRMRKLARDLRRQSSHNWTGPTKKLRKANKYPFSTYTGYGWF